MGTIRIGFTSDKPERLPDGMYHDDVHDELRTVVQAAVNAWYETRGKDLLRCEPDVS